MAGEIELIGQLIRKDQQPGGPVLPLLNADQVAGMNAAGSFVPVLASELVAGAINVAGLGLRDAIITLANGLRTAEPGTTPDTYTDAYRANY